jgi:hypothetical protein
MLKVNYLFCRDFLLHIAPCMLFKFMTSEYYNHTMLLTKGITLLSHKFTVPDLINAKEMVN